MKLNAGQGRSFLMIMVLVWGMTGFGCENASQNNSSEETEEKSVLPAVKTLPESADTVAENSIPESPVMHTESWVDYAEGIRPKQGKLFPVDQAQLNSTFFQFREKLLAAIAEKNVDFLLEHVDEDIKIGFGAEYGKEDFIKSWNLKDHAEQSLLWQQLAEVLSLGGVFDNAELSSFTAPYTFHAWVDDPYQYKVITGTQVRVRAEPRLQGPVLGSLNYEVVQSAELNEGEIPVLDTIENEVHSWEKIRTPQGQIGYVYGKFVRSPIDFRANFRYKEEKWMMTFFLAGD